MNSGTNDSEVASDCFDLEKLLDAAEASLAKSCASPQPRVPSAMSPIVRLSDVPAAEEETMHLSNVLKKRRRKMNHQCVLPVPFDLCAPSASSSLAAPMYVACPLRLLRADLRQAPSLCL